MELHHPFPPDLFGMRNFFLGEIPLAGEEVTITGELFRHMARVLRLKTGCEVTLNDPGGQSCPGVITEVGAKELTVRLTGRPKLAGDDGSPRITLFQGLPKGEKLDLVLQKCTELGIAEVITFQAQRSVVKLSSERSSGRRERCVRIVQEAARQSGRSSVPRVELGGELASVLKGSGHTVKLILWEGEREQRLREVLGRFSSPESVAVIVGPEGGLTEEEVERARGEGFVPVTLGERILRTETAGLAIVSILQFHWGNLG